MNTIEGAIFARGDGAIVILSDFNNLDAVGLRGGRLKYGDLLILLGMYYFGLVTVNHHMIDIPSIHHIPNHPFTIFEAEVYLEASPIILCAAALQIISPVKDNLISKWAVKPKVL